MAATWGSTAPRFKRALGGSRPSSIGLEETRAIPDLTASFGVWRFYEPWDDALVVGISLPLPVFNRNQGAILEVQRRVRGQDAIPARAGRVPPVSCQLEGLIGERLEAVQAQKESR